MSLLQNAERDQQRVAFSREADEQKQLQQSPLNLRELECYHQPFVRVVEETLATVGFNHNYHLTKDCSTMLPFENCFYKPAEATLQKYSHTQTQVRPGTEVVDSTVYGSRFTILRLQDNQMAGSPLTISVFPLRSRSTHFSEVQIMINVRNLVRTITLPDLVDTRKIQTTVGKAVYDWVRGKFTTQEVVSR